TITFSAGGTLAGSTGTTATYAGVISGTGPLQIGDGTNNGVIVLSGSNSYSGGTVINNTTLSVGADANLGGPSSGLTMNGGTLQTTANFSTARPAALNAAGGTFAPDAGTTFTEAGTITGVGGLTKIGQGT